MRRRFIAVIAAAFAITMFGAAPTWAVTITRTGATGTANQESWTWTRNYISNINLTVKDTACDNHSVYAYFVVHQSNGPDWSTAGRYNKQGCNTSVTWNGLYINNGPYDIKSVSFVVCTEGVACTAAAAYDNPKT